MATPYTWRSIGRDTAKTGPDETMTVHSARSHMSAHRLETAFTLDASSIKYGPGVTREVGFEMSRLGARRVMVVTDPGLSEA